MYLTDAQLCEYHINRLKELDGAGASFHSYLSSEEFELAFNTADGGEVTNRDAIRLLFIGLMGLEDVDIAAPEVEQCLQLLSTVIKRIDSTVIASEN